MNHGWTRINTDGMAELNYLGITGLKVGVILNFKHSKLKWQRVVL